MKKLLLSVLLILGACALCAQDRRVIKDASGRVKYVITTTSDGRQIVKDSQGRIVGSSTDRNGRTYYQKSNGSSAGSEIKRDTTSKYRR